ncbi:MAG: nucleic acid-binding protein [Euryarchaeota archaeon]|nr:nucleic acid-binding protein [Euryarchaeota archaeon]
MNKKKKVFIVDTSVFLSGKPLHIEDATLITTSGVSSEIQPGGRDFRSFELLQEKGLMIESPSKQSLKEMKAIAEKTGDIMRLSSADLEVLALAYDFSKKENIEVIILTDDYSIQNVADVAHLVFQGFSQKGITKRFKWHWRCPGCGKQFNESISICSVCGTEIKTVRQRIQKLKK